MSNVSGMVKLLRARHPFVRIVTDEEMEAVEVVRSAAAEFGLGVHIWSAVNGVTATDLANESAIAETNNAGAALVYWRRQIASGNPTVCVMLDLADHLHDPLVVRALRELAQHFTRLNAYFERAVPGQEMREGSRGTLVMIDHRSSVPPIVETKATLFEIAPPDEDELREMLRRTVSGFHREKAVEVALSKSAGELIIKNLRGLSRRQARLLIAESIAHDRKLDASDVHDVIAGKRMLMGRGGLLEFVQTPADLSGVGGLDKLKAWLSKREGAFRPEAAAFGLTPPRGLLLLGVQGAGKSLSAKAIAAAWKRPLYRLDPGVLYDRYVGETEKRLRDCLRQAETMAPIVLWIDEIEKAFASAAAQSTDGGLSKRMFGTLLTWMQEHAAPVFLVATANDIEALPPELLRKGRFDEIFFVDLPGPVARRQILQIHLRKRGRDPERFNLDVLVAATEGYSGAEIEQGVISALMHAFAASQAGSGGGGATGPAGGGGASADLSTQMLVDAFAASPPLSRTAREKIAALRQWALGDESLGLAARCVPAE
ncbi:MAG: AAA family ATPase [Planctomycetota bacterium]|nr:AAA family ATPase [Planctomycetota bacterium]